MTEIIPSHGREVKEILTQTRLQFIKFLMILAMISTFISPFILYFFKIDDPSIIFNGTVFILSLIVYIIVSRSKNYSAIYLLITSFCFGMLLYLNFSSELGFIKNDITFMTLFPFIAFFFLGKRNGLIFTVIFFVLGLVIVVVQKLPLGTIIIYRIIFSGAAITAMLFLYQFMQEKAEQLLKQREDELTIKIQQINAQKEEIERMNKLMIGRELAMTEMKEKVKELESKLH